MNEGQVHERLGFRGTIAGLAGHGEHRLEFRDGVADAPHEPPDLAAALVDLHDPARRQRR